MGPLLMEHHELVGELKSLQTEMRLLTQTVRDNQVESTREHRVVHDIVVATSEAVRNLSTAVSEMKPLTDDYRERRAEQRGAEALKRWLYAGAAAFGGVVVTILTKVWDFVMLRPPH